MIEYRIETVFFCLCLFSSKLVSDWLALAAGVRGFDLARSSGEAHLASFSVAPLHRVPPNPFNAQPEDIDCCMLRILCLLFLLLFYST